MVEQLMPHELRHPESTARVSRRRLNPDAFEGPLAQDATVGHAVERHSARQAEVEGTHLTGHWFNRAEEWEARRRGEKFDKYDYATEYQVEFAPTELKKLLSFVHSLEAESPHISFQRITFTNRVSKKSESRDVWTSDIDLSAYASAKP